MAKLKVYFETFGCTSNQADTHIMRGIVEKSHNVVNNLEDSEVVVINSCGVIAHTQRNVLKRLRAAKESGKRVVLAGCLSKIDPESFSECQPDGIITPDSIHLIGQALANHVMGYNLGKSTDSVDKAFLWEPNGSAIAAIPIAEGCIGSCSYCATQHARGGLKSNSMISIANASKKAISSGVKELQLTAQDTGIYGRENGSDLPLLINKISNLEGEFRVRIGMMNPSNIGPILANLIEAYQRDKIYKFLHLPLQSGDNEILKDMNRGYTVQDFIAIIRAFRKEIPNLTLSTDVILGYPTESEDQFLKTYQVIENIRPDILNITRFSSRPNTQAAALKDLPDRIKKERSRKMSSLAKKISLEINKEYLGKEEEVLITGIGRNTTLLARTKSYKQVVLGNGRIGEFRTVRIIESKAHYLVVR
jgi:MiaB-like tRNA modifying enzyme